MKKIILFAVLAFMAPMTCAKGNTAKGEELVDTCLACHGEIGNSLVPSFPNLAGQNAQYLLKQLLEIQSGQRQVLTMTGILDDLRLTFVLFGVEDLMLDCLLLQE